jgi:hypothetical protein
MSALFVQEDVPAVEQEEGGDPGQSWWSRRSQAIRWIHANRGGKSGTLLNMLIFNFYFFVHKLNG